MPSCIGDYPLRNNVTNRTIRIQPETQCGNAGRRCASATEVHPMALRPCKECGKQISTDARQCPNCGKKIGHSLKADVDKGTAIGCLAAAGLIILMLFLVVWLNTDKG